MNAQTQYQRMLKERCGMIKRMIAGNVYRQHIEKEFRKAFDELTVFYESLGLSKTLREDITSRARVVSDVGLGVLVA